MNKLRELRQAKGYTQKALAEACGLSKRTIEEYEKDGATLKVAKGDVLLKLSRALDVAIELLLADGDFIYVLVQFVGNDEIFQFQSTDLMQVKDKAYTYASHNAEVEVRRYTLDGHGEIDYSCYDVIE